MRVLKYAILGLLCNGSMTGYDLMKEFESTLKEFWHAKHSQIYPELKKLTAEGLIKYKIEIAGSSLEKKCYSLTEAGREDFLNWLAADTEFEPTPKSVFRLKVFYSGYLDKDVRIAQWQDQLRAHELRLSHLKNNQRKFTSVPTPEDTEFGDYLLLMGAIMREETNIEWLKKCLALLK